MVPSSLPGAYTEPSGHNDNHDTDSDGDPGLILSFLLLLLFWVVSRLIVYEICLFHPSFQVQEGFIVMMMMMMMDADSWRTQQKQAKHEEGPNEKLQGGTKYCPLSSTPAGRPASLSAVCLGAHSHINAPPTHPASEDRELKVFALWTVVPLGNLHIPQPKVS